VEYKYTKEQLEAVEKLKKADGCKCNHWYEIKTQEDIDFLLEKYGSFHDAYIKNIQYNGAIYWHRRSNDKSTISLFFESCWVEPKIEMQFSKLERLNLVGEKVEPFYDCFLSIEGEKIFFGDSLFDSEKINESANASIFAIARELRWRFIK